jgi:hypothetical protein
VRWASGGVVYMMGGRKLGRDADVAAAGRIDRKLSEQGEASQQHTHTQKGGGSIQREAVEWGGWRGGGGKRKQL